MQHATRNHSLTSPVPPASISEVSEIIEDGSSDNSQHNYSNDFEAFNSQDSLPSGFSELLEKSQSKSSSSTSPTSTASHSSVLSGSLFSNKSNSKTSSKHSSHSTSESHTNPPSPSSSLSGSLFSNKSSKHSSNHDSEESRSILPSPSSLLSGSLFSNKEDEYDEESFETESDVADEDYNADFENTIDFESGASFFEHSHVLEQKLELDEETKNYTISHMMEQLNRKKQNINASPEKIGVIPQGYSEQSIYMHSQLKKLKGSLPKPRTNQTEANNFEAVLKKHQQPKKGTEVPIPLYNHVKLQAINSLVAKEIVVEGIFSDKERKLHHEIQAKRHTNDYTKQHTTRLNLLNKTKEDNKENNAKKEEMCNPVLLIGQIHAERVNSIDEMIAQKRDIKNKTNHKPISNTLPNTTTKDSIKRLHQLFSDTSQLDSVEFSPPTHPQWEAKLYVDKSRACLDSLKRQHMQ